MADYLVHLNATKGVEGSREACQKTAEKIMRENIDVTIRTTVYRLRKLILSESVAQKNGNLNSNF